jgi:hypothetical protein
MTGHKGLKVAASYFFLTFNHEFDIAWNLAIAFHDFESLKVHEHLTFVITRAACKNSPFRVDFCGFNNGFERIIIP